MNDPEIEVYERGRSFAAESDADVQSVRTDVTQPPAPQDFQPQSTAHADLPVLVEVPNDALVETVRSDGRPCLAEFDGFRILALEPSSRNASSPSRNGGASAAVPPPALSLEEAEHSTTPPSPMALVSSSQLPVRSSSQRNSPTLGAPQSGVDSSRLCKWDGITEGEAGHPEGPWHSAFEDVQAPLWAEQLAAAHVPERLLRYVIGTQAVLRDWRASYLLLRYGRRLPWVAATAEVTEQAAALLGNIRTPQTEDGRRRQLRLQHSLIGLDQWLQELREVVEGGIITGMMLAAACTCVWTRVLQPLVPPWVVSACAVEWLTTVLSTPDSGTGAAALDSVVADPSARLVLFELVDVLCASRHAGEAVAFVAAARQTCRDSPNRNLPDEHAWVRVALRNLLWRADCLPLITAGRRSSTSEPPSEREEAESLSSFAPTSASAAEVLETVTAPQPSAATAALPSPPVLVWSWGMPLPLADAAASTSDSPCVWVEYPPAMCQRIEEAAAQSGFHGCHTVVVDDIGRAVSDCLLFLEDEIHFDSMTAQRGGVKLRLRRHGPPTTAMPPSPSAATPAAVLTRDEEAAPSAEVPSDAGSAMDLLFAIERRVLQVFPPLNPTPSSTLDSVPDVVGAPPCDDDVDWGGGEGQRPQMPSDSDVGSSPSGRQSKPWHAAIDLRRYASKRTWQERVESMNGAAPPQVGSDGEGVTHVLSGAVLRDSLHRLPRIDVAKKRGPYTATAAKLCAGSPLAPQQPDAVLVRYMDNHCDMVLSTSVMELMALLADERPAAKAATLYMSSTPDDVVPERVLLEHFDRAAEDATSSDDDDDDAAASASASASAALRERRSFTFDVLLHPCSRLCDSVVRRLSLRSGCVNLVRRLADAARRAVPAAPLPGMFAECVCTDGDHVVVVIGLPGALGAGLATAPLSETLGIARLTPSPISGGIMPNATAALQAHIRSLTPDYAKGAACSGVPLGGWKAHPTVTSLSAARSHRRKAGVDIPPAVPPSTALVNHLPSVSRTAFGIKPLLSRSGPDRQHDVHDVAGLGLSSQPAGVGPDGSPSGEHSATKTTTSVAVGRFVAPPFVPAETLGAHPRHPGATTEWAFLNSVKQRAAAMGREEYLLNRLRRHTSHLPAAPEQHSLASEVLDKELRSVVRRQAEISKRRSQAMTQRPPSGDAVPPTDPSKAIPIGFKLRTGGD